MGSKPTMTRHFPEQTTLSQPNTPTLDRIITLAETYREIITEYHGGVTWDEERQAEAQRLQDDDLKASLWQRRREEIVAAKHPRGRQKLTHTSSETAGGRHYKSKRAPHKNNNKIR